MAEQDLKSSIEAAAGLNIQAIGSDTTTVGNIIDTAGFESVTFTVATGTLVDGTFTLLLEDGDDAALADAATVASDFVVGTLPALSASDSAGSAGYVGKKRYVRASLVSTSVTSGGTVGVVAIKGHAASQPTA